MYNKNIFQSNNSLYHYMRAWIRVLDASRCYKRTGRAERKSALQGSGLVRVRTVGLCAQRRVALMPQAIATARDALSNDRHESVVRLLSCVLKAAGADVLATEL